MKNILIYKKTLIIAGLIFVELLSLLSFLNPSFNNAIFLMVTLLVFFAAVYHLEYALYILFAELIIGSKGYLFAFHFFDTTISIRMVIWLIILGVWFFGYSNELLKNKSWPKLNIPNFKLFAILFACIILGVVNGIWRQNGYSNIFFDFNGWLFFLLIFPLSYSVAPNFFNNIKSLFISSTVWLSIKTILLLYFFSHNFYILPIIYKWVRESGVGEITLIQSGFYRIFIQSHIYILAAFVTAFSILLFSIIKKAKDKKYIIKIGILSSFYLSVILISFSRSFWVGLMAAFISIYFFIFHILKPGLKTVIFTILASFSVVSIALIIITITVRFPFPHALGNFNTAGLLTDRANDLNGEAGVSSRWALLPVLSDKIFKSPLLGFGFGSTVTYRSSDPRVLSDNPSGLYTTYALEWGWLDIWLKIGFIGMAIYLFIIFYLIFKILRGIRNKEFVDKNFLIIGLSAALLSITVLNNFSPYLNHPLGIFFLLILNKFLYIQEDTNT
jgi:hypothetical protein